MNDATPPSADAASPGTTSSGATSTREATRGDVGADRAMAATPLTPRGLFVGSVAGFALVSLVTSTTTAVLVRADAPTTLLRFAWDLVLTSSIGAVAGGLLAAGRWGLSRTRFDGAELGPFVLGAAVCAEVVRRVLGAAIEHQADVTLDGAHATALAWIMIAGTGVGIALAFVLGVLGARRWWLSAPWSLLAIAGASIDAVLLRDDFFESHAIGAWAAASALGGVLAVTLERRLATRPRLARAAVALAALTLASAIFPPSNRARLVVFQSPAALGAWAHASTIWAVPSPPRVDALPIGSAWIADRRDRPPVPPTERRPVDGAPIVLLLTIDAVRADLLAADENDARWPNLAALKRDGAFFTRARSAGSQTAVSLTTLFSGRYFSELCWSKHGSGGARFVYAADDPSPRFPALLASHGVATIKVGGIKFLANEFGVAPGFTDETMVVTDRRHAYAEEVIDPLLARLRKAGPGPAFYYAHLMEPHAPYDRGAKTTGPALERYESEITVADEAIGRVLRLVRSPPLAERVLVIVSADHGEAFGEHGTFEHTKTLYDELLRVPLLVFGPHVLPRHIDEPVSLVDLGPTILDTFGVDTPGTFMGQSLVPMLTGPAPRLDRPVVAEGRLKRSLVAGDLKVIVDTRRKTLEGFDLARDPLELSNLFDRDPERVLPGLAALDRLFEAHRCPWPGYEPVYKP